MCNWLKIGEMCRKIRPYAATLIGFYIFNNLLFKRERERQRQTDRERDRETQRETEREGEQFCLRAPHFEILRSQNNPIS